MGGIIVHGAPQVLQTRVRLELVEKEVAVL